MERYYSDGLKEEISELQKTISNLNSTARECEFGFTAQAKMIHSMRTDIKIYIGINLSLNILIHVFVYLLNKKKAGKKKEEKRNGKKRRAVSFELERRNVRVEQESRIVKPSPTPRNITMPRMDSEDES